MSPTNKATLAPGFIEVEDAIKLINSDTRQNPVVDMDYLIGHVKWVETGHNFRIPRVKRLKPEEVYKTRRGKVVEYETIGDANIYIANNLQKELVRHAIYDKYRELVGHEYQAPATRAYSTVADDAQGRDAVKPRTNKPIAKEGQSIGSGETISTNGADLTV